MRRVPVPGFEGRYEINEIGQVVNKRTGLPVKVLNLNRGYDHVSLWNGEKPRLKRLHKLVALAFIPNPNDYPDINHIDGDKTNNCTRNLEWCTRSHNMLHAYRMGLHSRRKPKA